MFHIIKQLEILRLRSDRKIYKRPEKFFEMSEESAENQMDVQAAQNEEVAPAEDFSVELGEPRWSVVTFEKCVEKGLTYDEAFSRMEKLRSENKFGLCILTDEAAARIKTRKKR